jgi:hypothetical protein
VTGPRLLAYRFPPTADLEGRIAGALERMLLTAGGDLYDALFVTRDDRTGEPLAIDLATARAGGTPTAMLDFRLDERRRRALTTTTLARGAGGAVDELAAALEPGATVLVVLTGAGPAPALQDAVARSGGRLVADEPAGAGRIAELKPGVLAAAVRPIHTT